MVKSLKEKRWHKATLIAWLLQIVPFIRFIGITGSMAHDAIKPNSDIDIFIITTEKKIWTARFFLRSVLKITFQLRVGDKPHQRAGKICPNRYLTDKYLVINPQNQYHAQDYTQMIPLYDENSTYKKFIIANKWMEKYGYFQRNKVLNLVQSRTLVLIRKILESILAKPIGDKFEDFCRKKGMKELKSKFYNINKPGSKIIANDNEIRIHVHPH